jgi:single-stranded-DNA-specific exonuclease
MKHAFLHPSLLQLHPPSLIPDLDRAADRLLTAAKRREPIVIYGDYDVDGVSASAILYHTLRHIVSDAAVSVYIPHRLDEGYGINTEAVRSIAAAGARVIVSVDCGITAIEPALAALEAGVDLIITDHHNPPRDLASLPRAYAVVHPRRPDSAYPFGELCGAGVAFKLAWRLCTMAHGSDKVDPRSRDVLLEMLALASLGVIADVVPLLGENRVMARFGLARIKRSTITGLRALVEASGLAGDNVGAEDVGFKLGPRLNACGRLGHAREAAELLTTADPARSREIATALTKLNNERRAMEARITEQATELAAGSGMCGDDRRAILLAHEDWHKGVVGIVCSRLVGKFHRPTILMQRQGDECHGSGRSIDGFSLHSALEECADVLLGFGGHDMAAGVRVRADRLDEFTARFTEVANRRLLADDLRPTVRYDTIARIDELASAVVQQLDAMGPFGRDNPRPALSVRGVVLEDRARILGSTGRHASILVRQGLKTLRIVAWDRAAELLEIPARTVLDLIITPKMSSWNGSTAVEAELVDLRAAEA